MKYTEFYCDKRVFKALTDISEVLYGLVQNSSNYSQSLAKKLSETLTSINKLIKVSPPK